MKQKLEENDLETIYIKDEISKCEGIEELKELSVNEFIEAWRIYVKEVGI